MTGPSYPRLHEAFTDLADGVTATDLTGRALRTSRRLGLRRTTVATIAVLLLTGGGTAAAAQLWPVPGGGARSPAGPGAEPNAGPQGGVATTCPVGGVPVDPGPSPNFGPKVEVQAPNTGPLFYLQARGSTVRLVSWIPGKPVVVLRRELPADALANANVSPDGKWVSWVTRSDGKLHLAALDGDKSERVLRDSVDGEQLEPVWARDSTRLLVRDRSTNRVGTVDIHTGTFTPLPTNLPAGARHAIWASDGSAIAFITADGGIVVAKPDGSGQRRIPAASRFAKEGRRVASLQSMSGTGNPYGSSDGEALITLYVTGSGQQPGACRSLVSNTVIWTKDGTQGQDEAQRGGDYTAYQAGYRGKFGSHVTRDLDNPRSVALIGDNGEFWGGADEPTELKDYLLLNN
jgi:hypothetical protein